MGRTSNILQSDVDLNPNYDIVWSFKFLLSSTGLTSNHQGGFVTYLVESSAAYSVGGGSYFIGYDNNPITSGLSGAALGIAFDSTGLFAVSSIGSRTSGVDISKLKRNSIAVRGQSFDCNLLYNESISALSTNFTLLTNTEDYQWLRLRLGNVGQTLYIDHRRNDYDQYTSLAEIPVSINFGLSTKYSIGFSYTYPITSTSFAENQANTILRIKNLQVEGITGIPDTYVFSTTSASITALEIESPTEVTPDILSVEDDHIFIT